MLAADGEYADLYVNNYDGILINFLGHELDRRGVAQSSGLSSKGEHAQWVTNLWSRPWVNQYDKLMEQTAADRASFTFSSNLVCEFQGAELSISGRATSVQWFRRAVWPLLLQQSALQSPTLRGVSPRSSTARQPAEPVDFTL